MDAKELQDGEETERILVSWPKSWFPGAKTAPQIAFEDSPSGLVLKLRSASISSKLSAGRLTWTSVAACFNPASLSTRSPPMPIPPSSDVVPPELLKYLGYICQSHLRLQTLLSAATAMER